MTEQQKLPDAVTAVPQSVGAHAIGTTPPVGPGSVAPPPPLSVEEARKALDQHARRIENLGETVDKAWEAIKNVNWFLVGVVIVFFLGFVGTVIAVDGLLVEHYRSKEATYHDLAIRIVEQNHQLQQLGTAIADQTRKIDELTISFAQLKPSQSPRNVPVGAKSLVAPEN